MNKQCILMALMLGLTPSLAFAGGPFGIDHRIAYDNSGIWKRSYQQDLEAATALTVIGSALWFGGDDTYGDTSWRALDASVLAAATTQVMKWGFSRERPSKTADPGKFFAGGGNQSFPSGEVAFISAAVTPYILAYGDEHPAVYALALLPVYDAIARVKVRGHWQSDVLVGAAVGVGFGWYAERREHPLILSVLPGGFYVGIHKSF